MIILYRFLVAVLLLSKCFPALSENYIISVWATALPASDGSWWARVIAANPTTESITYKVTRVFPLVLEPCAACGEFRPAGVIAPGASLSIGPGTVQGYRVKAAAFELETSAPLALSSTSYRPGANEIRQRLEVAHRWLGPGQHAVSDVEADDQNARTNAFVINPNDTAIVVTLWIGNRAENMVALVVPPGSVNVVTMPQRRCGEAPCVGLPEFPPRPVTLYLESSARVLAVVSTVSDNWAVFSLPDSTRAISAHP